MTPEGEHDQADDDDATPGEPPRRSAPITADFGWDRPMSSQPPGERITWEGEVPPGDAAPGSPDITRPDVRASRAADEPGDPAPPPPPPPPPPPGAPAARPTTLRQPPAASPAAASAGPRPDPVPAFGDPRPADPGRLGGPSRGWQRRPDDRPVSRPEPPARQAPAAPDPGPRPARPLPAVPSTPSIRPGAAQPAGGERPAPPLPSPEVEPAVEPAVEPVAERVAEVEATAAEPAPPAGGGAGSDQGAIDTLKAQLGALARQEAEGQRGREQRAERAAGRAEVTGELAQQLAATQSQVAALAAQLTTLSHRISYDLERSAQTTSERLLRDIATIPDTVRASLGADLGPAIDDLTDQIEADRTKLSASIAGVQHALEPRLHAVSDVIEALPLSNVEILNALQGVGSEIEDRFTRFAARVGDQLAALERSTSAELVRLRTQVDDLRASVARPSTSAEALDRMAGQVERLVQRTPSADDVVEALELLVGEHLEVLRDNLDTRVAALGPTMHDELEVVRTEALANMTSAEEVLGERVEAMEASLFERMDLAMADQIDAVDALVTDRHAQLLGTLRTEGLGGEGDDEDATAELTEAVTSTNERLDVLAASLDELRTQVEALADRPVADAAGGEAMAAINEELKALRRRISLRLESPDTPVLTPEQIAAIAAQLADHLR